jgi:hypothetical protein
MLSAVGLAGAVLATLSTLGLDTNLQAYNPTLSLVSVMITYTDMLSLSLDADDNNNIEKTHLRGSYNLVKSLDLLPGMLRHPNLAWYRQFFRYVL